MLNIKIVEKIFILFTCICCVITIHAQQKDDERSLMVVILKDSDTPCDSIEIIRETYRNNTYEIFGILAHLVGRKDLRSNELLGERFLTGIPTMWEAWFCERVIPQEIIQKLDLTEGESRNKNYGYVNVPYELGIYAVFDDSMKVTNVVFLLAPDFVESLSDNPMISIYKIIKNLPYKDFFCLPEDLIGDDGEIIPREKGRLKIEGKYLCPVSVNHAVWWGNFYKENDPELWNDVLEYFDSSDGEIIRKDGIEHNQY